MGKLMRNSCATVIQEIQDAEDFISMEALIKSQLAIDDKSASNEDEYIYKVKLHSSFRNKKSDEEELASSHTGKKMHDHDQIDNLFMSLFVKEQIYRGKNVIVIFINNVTQKIKAKLQDLGLKERQMLNKYAETFTQIVSDDMRMPLEQILFFV